MGRRLYVVTLTLAACLFASTGHCFVEESIPERGSTVAGGEGESVSFYCRVLNEVNGTQMATEWFIERIGAGGSGPQTIVGDSNFNIVGETLPSPPGVNFQTNLTIRNLTSDLDRANLSCGLGGTPITIGASFILRIYWSPNLTDNLPVVAVEGSTNTVSLRQAPDAFPFPQQFSWTVNGSPASSNSRVTFGYPSVTFLPFIRGDAGTYTLTATNNRLDNTSVVVGTDTGSFTLDVQYPPEFVGPEADTAVLEGGNITLVCATSVNGNPTPTISWMDNNGTAVSNGTGISGATTLSLTVSGVTSYQAGNWTCTAENSRRAAERQVSLTVVVPPSRPRNVSIQSMDIGSTFARVCWQPPSSRGIPTVSRYVITVTEVNGSADPLTFNTPDATRDFNVTGLAPGTTYEFRVSAISEAEMVVGQSFPSDPFSATTNLTVPAPVCPTPPTSSGGVITVRWSYTHTGGVELTQVIVTATKGILSTELDVPNSNLTDPSQTYLNISTFTAGFLYTFSVTAYNELGNSFVQCEPVEHQIGIPQVPQAPMGAPNGPGSVLLTLNTAASGRAPPGMFWFDVNFTRTSTGMEGSEPVNAFNYRDGDDHQVTIDGLMEGEQYVFSAQARNQFGSSGFSGNSDLIVTSTAGTPTTSSPSETSETPSSTGPTPPPPAASNAGAIAGGVIGGFILVLLLVLIILLVVYLILRNSGAGSYQVEGGRRVKVEEVGDVDIGLDLQGNTHNNNTGEKLPPRELHYADLETFKPPKSRTDAGDDKPKPAEDPVEYATIASVKKQEEMKSEEQGTEGGDKSQTATTLV